MPDKGLTGHVWVMDGETGVIGHMTADAYRVLARYENRRSPAVDEPRT